MVNDCFHEVFRDGTCTLAFLALTSVRLLAMNTTSSSQRAPGKQGRHCWATTATTTTSSAVQTTDFTTKVFMPAEAAPRLWQTRNMSARWTPYLWACKV